MVNYHQSELDSVFSSLSDPTRREILFRISNESLSVKDIAQPYDISLPAISKHLKVLERADLIKRTRHGRQFQFEINPQPLKNAAKHIEYYKKYWSEDFEPIVNYLVKSMISKKEYKVGIVIGRFQPFHNGHAYLIKRALKYCDKIVIVIGVSNKRNKDNPFNFSNVKQMVDMFVESENLDGRIPKIILIKDVPNDSVWLKRVLEKSGEVDVAIGDNAWVNGIFEDYGLKTIKIGYLNRNELEGKKIRKLMKEGKKWQNRVPLYLTSEIKKNIKYVR